MKYLKTVILENFQSHKYSIVEFNEGLNVIVGPSDTGKSAIIRGIKWALYNEPAGDYFIREGERDCTVTLEFSDNTKVKRYRSKSKNVYILIKNDGEEIKYEGFGTSVPQEIIDEIGIEKIYLDSEESNSINLGEQLEGPFLLSEKTSTRASAIGRLIGVNIIDDALKEALRDLRNASIKKKNLDVMISLVEEDLKEYDYLEDLSSCVEKIDKIKDSIKEKSLKLDILNKTLIKSNQIQMELKEVKFQLESLKNLNKLDSMVKNIEAIYRNYRYFNSIKENMDRNSKEIISNENLLRRLNDVNKIEDICADIDKIRNKRNNLLLLENKMKINTNNLNVVKSIYNGLINLPVLRDNINILEENIKRLVIINKLKENYTLNQKSIGIGTIYISELSKVENIFDVYNKLEDNLKRLYVLQGYLDKRTRLINELKSEAKIIEKMKNNIDNELQKYKVLLNKLEVCPLCLSRIDSKKIQHIMEHYN